MFLYLVYFNTFVCFHSIVFIIACFHARFMSLLSCRNVHWFVGVLFAIYFLFLTLPSLLYFIFPIRVLFFYILHLLLMCFCLFSVPLFIWICLFTFVIHDLCSPSRNFSFSYVVLFHDLFIFSVVLFVSCYILLVFILFVSTLVLIVITFHSYTAVFVISNNYTGFVFICND